MLVARVLGEQPYAEVWERMRAYTEARGAGSADELWLVAHPAVFTLGQAGRREHLLDAGDIPVIESARGGQVTHHGPGQVVVYALLDLRRAGIGVRRLVEVLEQAVIDLLAEAGLEGDRREGAPGVYVAGAKIAALGLRVRRGCSYHGIALNVAMDLAPFRRIEPCGYRGLEVTQLADLGVPWTVRETERRLVARLAAGLGRDVEWRPASAAAEQEQ